MQHQKHVIVGSGPLAMWIAYLLTKSGLKPLIIGGLDKDNAGLHSGHQWHLTGCISSLDSENLKWYKLPFLPLTQLPVSYCANFFSLKKLSHHLNWYKKYIYNSLKNNAPQSATHQLQAFAHRSKELHRYFSSIDNLNILSKATRWNIIVDQASYQKTLKETERLQKVCGMTFEVVDPIIAASEMGLTLNTQVKCLLKFPNEGRISANWRDLLVAKIIAAGGEFIPNAQLVASSLTKSGKVQYLLVQKETEKIELPVTNKPIVAAGIHCFDIANKIFSDSSPTGLLLSKSDILPVSGLSSIIKFKQGNLKSDAVVMWQDHYIHLTKYDKIEDAHILTVGAVPGGEYTYTKKEKFYRNAFLEKSFVSEYEILSEKACPGRPMPASGQPIITESSRAIYATGLGYCGMTTAPSVAEKLLLQHVPEFKSINCN